MKTTDANEIHRHHGTAVLRDAIDAGELDEGPEDQVIPFPGRGRPYLLFKDIDLQVSKDWLVRNLLGADEATAFYGRPGDGTSVLAEDMALHIAAGREWHGRKVKQGAVVYVALERKKLVERRAIAFRLEHGLTDLPFAIVGGVHDFRNSETAVRLSEIVAEVKAATGQPVVLIVIDTLSRALCGGDENSPKDMGAIVHATSILQERTGAHVLWVHHMPLEGAERMRGRGALLGALDTTVHVVRGDTVRTATVIKANDAEEGEQIAFTLKSVVIGHDADQQENDRAGRCASRIQSPAGDKIHQVAEDRPDGFACSYRGDRRTGPQPPASNHIPPGVKVVSVRVWRQQSYLRGISTGEEQAKQKAFKSASEYLIGAGRVGVWDDQVWLVG
jgi:hypothetical protein